ncbi:MAG: TonB family protein [Acidobacteria bacterium]|nr:TonB family protein [Acidobacteriota bacterium]MBV9478459.1 TonB family protein [Acidobacteriota bacterium]
MSENILVVEYEPRYTDRVRQALSGQPFTPTFARDGEEAIRVLDSQSQPRLIVLSSVVPKISTTELIRAIRGRKPLQETPILLTVSGYNGKSPKADAQRVGASDILPKPYSETEFLGKVQQMLGVRGETPSPAFDPDFTVRASAPAASGQLTSNEIFGDLFEEDKPKKPASKTASTDVDKMLADTLSGVRPARKKEAAPTVVTPLPTPAPAPAPPPAPSAPAANARPAAPAPQPTAQAKPRTSSAELDKMLEDTLSGVRKPTSSGNVPRPAAAPVPPTSAPAQDNKRFNTERLAAYAPTVADRVPVSQPVIPAAEPHRAVEDDEPVDGVKFGQYVLVEKIATGGMAEVWKARMRGVEGFQKIVAIKKILPHLSDNQDFIEMFVDEAKLAAQLNHNNIIHIYDLGKIQSSYYIAMEYIDGYDLKTILRRGEERDHPMSVELALFIASKIASALDYAHRKKDFEEKEMGLVHRDVSPQNVLISQEGDIKLCDFGIAKAASKASHTQAGALKGKLQYMAPEQAWGRHIDRRSDIFALATVLFEMLTNRKLFTGDNELSILEQVREARVVPPSQFNDEVTPQIDAIVLKALQKDPANRYQTAGEMARDIDAVLYSFRPTPTSADLAIYMHRLSSPEPAGLHPEPIAEIPAPAPAPHIPPPVAAAPVIAAAPVAAAAPAAAPFAPAAITYDEPPKKKTALIAIAAVVLIAIIAGAFVMTRKSSTAATPVQTASASTAPAGAPLTTTAPLAKTTAASSTTAATSTAPVIDNNAVDAEVQKRMAAERARLEAQARAQQQAQANTETPAPVRSTPAAPVTQAPAPVQQETRPAPAPVQQETRPAPAPVQQQPAEREPAPAPSTPATREGDLVAAGTDGLVAPRLLRRGVVAYPPMARIQRVEGTVVTNVLVSETGQVLEVRVLRGINRPVGLNEAAEQTMRRSTFAPATKDGVRVKSWVTVPVEFKL